MLLFWVLFMGLGGWWATSWLEQRLNPNANLNQVAEGEPGYFAQQLNVYGRYGQPCLRCGSELRRRASDTRFSSRYCRPLNEHPLSGAMPVCVLILDVNLVIARDDLKMQR